ncbi:hypothetical protein KUCAC02_011131, partial [Chaenocephalus aceratus]
RLLRRRDPPDLSSAGVCRKLSEFVQTAESENPQATSDLIRPHLSGSRCSESRGPRPALLSLRRPFEAEGLVLAAPPSATASHCLLTEDTEPGPDAECYLSNVPE